MKPKFLLGGSLIVAAAIFLIASNMATTAQYFLTVSQLRERESLLFGQSLRRVRLVGGVLQLPTVQLRKYLPGFDQRLNLAADLETQLRPTRRNELP